MDFNKFPPDYKEDLDIKTREQISIENQKCSERQARIRESKKKEEPKINSYTTGFGALGLIGGFFPCLYFGSQGGGILGMLFTGFATWAVCIAIGIGVGYVIHSSRESSYKQNNLDISNLQEQERIKSEERIKGFKADAMREYQEYLRKFDIQAKNESVKFASSELAEKVIDWMTKGFIVTIKATDRRAHIETIEVPFSFNVYKDRITCNLGEFDFEVERCRNLNTPLEQTALGRAIATAIQLNITMEFPEDPSGSNIVIDIHNNYFKDYVSTNITYTAPNGNYEVVKSW